MDQAVGSVDQAVGSAAMPKKKKFVPQVAQKTLKKKFGHHWARKNLKKTGKKRYYYMSVPKKELWQKHCQKIEKVWGYDLEEHPHALEAIYALAEGVGQEIIFIRYPHQTNQDQWYDIAAFDGDRLMWRGESMHPCVEYGEEEEFVAPTTKGKAQKPK